MIFIGWIHTPYSISVAFSVFHLPLSLTQMHTHLLLSLPSSCSSSCKIDGLAIRHYIRLYSCSFYSEWLGCVQRHLRGAALRQEYWILGGRFWLKVNTEIPDDVLNDAAFQLFRFIHPAIHLVFKHNTLSSLDFSLLNAEIGDALLGPLFPFSTRISLLVLSCPCSLTSSPSPRVVLTTQDRNISSCIDGETVAMDMGGGFLGDAANRTCRRTS